MKRIGPIILVIIIVALVSAAIWRGQSPAAPGSVDILASGFIEATNVAVAPEVSGRIIDITVSEGDQVKAGAVLVRLDDALLKAQQAQGEAVVAQAQATVEQAQAVVDQAQALVEQATMSRNQAVTVRDGARKAWDNALNVQKFPLDIDVQLVAAQGQVDVARSNLALAIDSYRKITYPYTYSTFAFDVPTALGYMAEAQAAIDDIQKRLQTGLTAEQYNEIYLRLQQALEKLTRGREALARGQGEDVFQSDILNVKDFWTLRAAQLQMDQAQSSLNTAQKTLQIMQDKKNNPQQINAAVDSAQAAYDNAAAAVQVAGSAVSAAQRQVAIAQKQVVVAQKQVEQARASLEVIRVQLSKIVITSPASGVVATRNAEIGEIASPAARLLIITDLSHLTLTAYVPESRIGLVKLGQNAQVSVDSYPGQAFSGVITFISPQALFTPGNVQLKDEREKTVFAVKIKLANPEQKLKPGMPADARIAAGQ